ncbi:flagellar basal-body MS-ring/collar protein FliF [Novilysobacter selenitireducens]|uniref:Flagellar M-ring protein n=1 Tax=Novilysobacter selenitireducens TaxID=2872639 RepID=A0ABS7T967_9GAMM|nr:flagellar basal-body MS-ring/collar protein FliF [Lysobacter selenitireducens]MBZ4040444.1 flagellar M-ring protein FliF [Lysobacter selenitireducens]
MSVITLPKGTSNQLRDLGRLQDIPAVRQLGVFALAALAIAIGLWLFFWTQKPDYVPVFAGLDAKATSEASDLLRSANIPFRIDSGSGALAVPQDNLGDAKLALAAAGLPASQSGGFEMISQDQGFGTSQFVENARYQHALENELARTISNLRPVREARVHLALPKPSAFTRQKEPASASVVLQMQSGSTLEQGQVAAIVHLVASSIPSLPPENVTVVDQFGRMLSNPDPNSDEAIGAKQFEQRGRQEAVYVQRIQELLEPMTGRGRVSAQVSVDMDFAQTEEAREIYGPDAGLVRSEQISETGDIDGAGASAQGVPGAVANTPTTAAAVLTDTPAAAPANADNGPSARTAVRNYELDRTLTHTRGAPVRIRRVTAAVLIDNVPQVGTEGQVSYRALNAAELQRIDALVKQAIGFDETRGDMISVVNAPFAPGAAMEDMPGPPFWENPRVVELARTILGGLAVLVFILAVLRPAFRAMLAPKTTTTTAVAEVVSEETHVSITPAAGQPQVQAPRQPSQASQAALNFDEKLQVARTAVSSDPKRVANVVRNWVEADG